MEQKEEKKPTCEELQEKLDKMTALRDHWYNQYLELETYVHSLKDALAFILKSTRLPDEYKPNTDVEW